MSNLTGNQKRIGFLKGKTAQAAGNYFARLGRYDIAREEYEKAITAYKLVEQTFPDFVEAQNNKKTVQKLLDELPVRKSRPTEKRQEHSATVCDPLFVLGQWLQNKFEKATEAGWLTLEEIFGTKDFAFRTKAVKRAKQINLVTDRVALVIELNESENQEIRVLMRVSPLGKQNYLPENIKFTVIPELGEPDEYLTESHNPGFEKEWFYKHGERFSVKIQLDNVSITEDFVI